jgi:DNA adenine methylase
MGSESPPVRSLLKWAGGKRQLLPALRGFYPEKFASYREPFLGSGAVFFDLRAAGRIRGKRVCLADGNPDLIGCYREVRDRPDEVILALEGLAEGHRRRGQDFYYEVRNKRFNPARAAGDPYTPELAAMFVYLNRTGYNGLFRVNRRGGFNVPAGRYANPTVCDSRTIHAVSAALRCPEVSLRCEPFDEPLAEAGAGDFVYCDPPYAPLSRTACFAHYTPGGFSADDQARLQAALIAAASRGAIVVLSNSSAPQIERLYRQPAARAAGFSLHRVPARRTINARATARGAVDELIVTNARPRPVDRMLKIGLNVAQRRA